MNNVEFRDVDLVTVTSGSKVFGPLMRVNADNLVTQLALKGEYSVKIINEETNA